MTLLKRALFLVGVISFCFLANKAEGCGCFSEEDLLDYTETTTDFQKSCRESHSLRSGIGMFKKEPLIRNGKDIGAQDGYYVHLDSDMPTCLFGGDLDLTLGSLADGESCAALIRERCAAIQLVVVEY
mmetsp:Transcript_5887/g.7507  ORF Transcript_5887/g.7507 Transcript_5887/m.7507 type:complete len:128 (-) Transcript_5887:241-624(-)